MRRYDVAPTAKVRQTQSDRWKKRPCVMRYRAFADALREKDCELKDGDAVTFVIAMPDSWSEKKRREHDGKHHRQRPDLDNLLGGLMDAIMPDSDSHIAYLATVSKIWGRQPAILIGNPYELPATTGNQRQPALGPSRDVINAGDDGVPGLPG